ncbi:ImmA/IrrE family metallo-endopeptidase [Deefgea salmonis]|uniref:ImmA/IrrE family metallo-endopeptidase n=1 Tax=Deefgea salmonis TaxID=2875502 RepID=A0ABS8BIL9_9NEIS|nr:ImmA/IrrE family metallo-endopeptidase [Deefgea salmonis]MCB5195568.1 ImmA/IrrE family metallo-endopeptidase [Deefgea salmonis]
METIQLSPVVLEWAAAQAGYSLDELANKLSKKAPEKILDGILTNAQVIKFAKTTGTTLGYLFLDEPPSPRKLPVADFRTTIDPTPLSKDFFDTFDDIEFKQSWYRDYLMSNGVKPHQFVKKYQNTKIDISILAQEICAELDFKHEDRMSIRNAEELYSLLVNRCERIGILVFKNGVVGNNTSKHLSVSEFRGFALADEVAPTIFINGADAPAAWVFTLAHELAHIWKGNSGVSDASPISENQEERFCNAVAAEILVPTIQFKIQWDSAQSENALEKIDQTRRVFKVSNLVIARKALDLGYITYTTYNQIYNLAKQKKQTSSGGDFYATLAVRNSKLFSKQVSNLAISGAITLGQAGRLLNTNPNNVVKFYAKQNTVSV